MADLNWKGFDWWFRDFGGSPMYNGNWDPANISGPDGTWPRNLDYTYFYDNSGSSASVTESIAVPATVIQTHRMIWEPGRLTMESWEGEGTGGTLINSKTWTSNIATPYDEQVYFNTWVFDDSNHYGDPDGATPQNFTLIDFSFTPLSQGNFLQFF